MRSVSPNLFPLQKFYRTAIIKFCENNLTRQKKKTWVFHLISCTRSWNYLIHQISKAHDKNRERYLLYLWRICMNFPGFVQPSYKQKRFNLSNKLQNNSNIYFLFLVKLLFFSFAKIQNSTFLNRMVAKKIRRTSPILHS